MYLSSELEMSKTLKTMNTCLVSGSGLGGMSRRHQFRLGIVMMDRECRGRGHALEAVEPELVLHGRVGKQRARLLQQRQVVQVEPRAQLRLLAAEYARVELTRVICNETSPHLLQVQLAYNSLYLSLEYQLCVRMYLLVCRVCVHVRYSFTWYVHL